MKLFVSNKIEILADQLAHVLDEPVSSPFIPESVVVQSKGMERWLSMQIAARHGICANIRFPFPNAAVHDLFTRVVPDVPGETIFDVEGMTWGIMEKLSAHIHGKGFEGVARYLEGDASGIKRYQLSRHLAETFDQYVVFRDKAVLGWQEGRFSFPEKDRGLEYWQSVLWRDLAAGHEHEHRAYLKKAFMETLGPDIADVLPERLSIFGVSYLPLFHLEIFRAVSAFIPVNLFLMNPCCQYWGDIRSGSETARIYLKNSDIDREALHFEEGNPLLASYGELGRQLFDVLEGFEIEQEEAFADMAGTGMLACLQNDILRLRDPLSEEKHLISAQDRSLQIHSCHSPMREVEVLRDNLLALFDKNPRLKPEDIVVMTPDIETYAPFIQAVFDVDRGDSFHIPFSIADRTISARSDIADTFLAILDLADARFEASRVLSLLESGPVQKKFDILDDGLDLIRNWVEESRIRWGRDGQGKEELGLPGFEENTWRFGLDRLILGYALRPEHGRDFAGILPCEGMEGDGAVVLGNFLSFVSSLFEHVATMRQARSLDDWSSVLISLLDGFFCVEEAKETDFRNLRRILAGLAGIRDRTGYASSVSLDVVRAYIGQCLEVRAEGMGFLSSGVTFCAMLPMRSIPFAVVCLLGMDHAAYPRHFRPKGFDLMARNPQKGDRNRRSDDLYLFLEAMLSARQVLYMSYLGQRSDDNTDVPPSVLVSSLLDYAEQRFAVEGGSSAADHVVTKHALQAFNPRYFTGSSASLFSYSQENADAAACLAAQDRSERVFWTGTLDEPGPEWKTIDVDGLCDFYVHPARFLLKNRLGMVVSERSYSLDDREPFALDALEYYTAAQQHIGNMLEGMDHERSLQLFRMSGQLPHGAPGDALFRHIDRQTGTFTQVVESSCRGYTPEAVMADLLIGGFAVTGTIPTYGSRRVVRFRHAELKGADILRTWIYHLVLCAAHHSPGVQSLCIARDQVCVFEPMDADACRDILATLLDLYWQGLMRPLHFFPNTSWTYIVSGRKKDRPSGEPMKKAREAWEGTDYIRGEGLSAYYRICFLGTDPLEGEFAAASQEVYGPLMDHVRITKNPGELR